MLRSLGIGRWIGLAAVAMVALAIWKANNGDVSKIAEGVWSLLNMGADVVRTLWDSFQSSTDSGSVADTASKAAAHASKAAGGS